LSPLLTTCRRPLIVLAHQIATFEMNITMLPGRCFGDDGHQPHDQVGRCRHRQAYYADLHETPGAACHHVDLVRSKSLLTCSTCCLDQAVVSVIVLNPVVAYAPVHPLVAGALLVATPR